MTNGKDKKDHKELRSSGFCLSMPVSSKIMVSSSLRKPPGQMMSTPHPPPKEKRRINIIPPLILVLAVVDHLNL